MQIRIGTRGSKLAMWQANLVKGLLENAGVKVSLEEVKTEGDLVQNIPLHQMGSVGIFTKALDEALYRGDVDIAVHSAKDMPSAVPEGLQLMAVLKREDPRDVLVANSVEVNFENFSRNWTIGTSSVRRRALLKHYFSHVNVKDIRGNLDTRLAKLDSGEYDGLILAYAGLKRMGWERKIVQKLNPMSFTPAVGQGAIAIVGKAGHPHSEQIRQLLHHEETGFAVRSERAFLKTIEGGCHTPAFGLATVTGDHLSLTAGIAADDGESLTRITKEGMVSEAEQIGTSLALEVLENIQ